MAKEFEDQVYSRWWRSYGVFNFVMTLWNLRRIRRLIDDCLTASKVDKMWGAQGYYSWCRSVRSLATRSRRGRIYFGGRKEDWSPTLGGRGGKWRELRHFLAHWGFRPFEWMCAMKLEAAIRKSKYKSISTSSFSIASSPNKGLSDRTFTAPTKPSLNRLRDSIHFCLFEITVQYKPSPPPPFPFQQLA